MSDTPIAGKPPKQGGILGSLKDALAAASRDDTGVAANRGLAPPAAAPALFNDPAPEPKSPPDNRGLDGQGAAPPLLSAAEAAREARGVTSLKLQDKHMEFDGTNTTRMVRMPKTPEPPAAAHSDDDAAPPRTQLVRGRQAMKRGQFVADPVVGWLVIVGGPGLGSYRPVFEGNNTIGRSSGNRISLDFGDEAISAEEQAYLRYDSNDRSFLLVPNMSKTNIVSLNNTRPTTAVELKAMDVIIMGRTQLVFMPFCGPEFDWSEISESMD
jgi:hypothetical protein